MVKYDENMMKEKEEGEGGGGHMGVRGRCNDDRVTSHSLVVSTHILNNSIDWTLKQKFRQHLPDIPSGMGAFWKIKALIATRLWLVILVIHGIGALAQQYPPQDDVAANDMYPSPLKTNVDTPPIPLQPQQSNSVESKELSQEPLIDKRADLDPGTGTCDCNNVQLDSSSQDIQAISFISLDARVRCGKKCQKKKAKKAKKKAKKTRRKKQNKRIQKLRGKSKEEN